MDMAESGKQGGNDEAGHKHCHSHPTCLWSDNTTSSITVPGGPSLLPPSLITHGIRGGGVLLTADSSSWIRVSGSEWVWG